MSRISVSKFYIPTKIVKGIGALEHVGTEAKTLKASKALIVTGKNLAKIGYANNIHGLLKSAGIETEIFDEVMPDPTVKLVEKGTEIVKNGNFDVIIGLGGGSNIDAAKAMSVMANNPGSITDYEGSDKFQNSPMPIIAIPTTAGTGSEVSYSSVITDTDRNYKFVVWSSLLVPRVAILDPQMPSTAPTIVRIAAGMDALTHAIESYLSKNANVYSETLALSAIRLIEENLRQSIADSHNATAMSNMQIAANMAGMAFTTTRLGIVHALALPPSALFHVPHGLANAILLPHGMEFNLIANPKKFANIARSMGEHVESSTKLMEAAMSAVDAVVELADDIGAPATLESVGVTKESIPKMAEDGMKSGHIAVNPRYVTLEDAMMILEKAY
ncbi:MAG: Iron-containing alcohol dehydrogenase [Candidatus Poribacteria bacterium]|nr:Iron-containing alcohol dehydrogenase [Candidatus Poribacteria bacterium]